MTGLGRVIRRVALGLGLAAAAVVAAQAESARFTVQGEGRATAAPDMATMTIGVSARDDAANDAMEETVVAMGAVRTRLMEIGIAARDMQTGVLALQPRPDRETGEVTGFEARNTLDVTVRDLDLLGQAFDAALAEGANELHGLRFGLADPAPLEAEARQDAVENARERADSYADAAGVSIGRIIRLQEDLVSDGPQPMLRMESAAGIGDALAEGEVSVRARITVDYSFR